MKDIFQPFEVDLSTSIFKIKLNDYKTSYRYVSYSPDSTKIVYSKANSTLPFYNICMADADGSNEKYITNLNYHSFKPSLSPSGLLIFHTIAGNQTDLILVDINDPSLVLNNITNSPNVDEYDPAFAHNSDTIYFVQGKIDGLGKILSMDSTANNVKTIIEKSGHYQDITVSFDGQKILFSYREAINDPLDIYMVNIDGNSLKQLTFGTSSEIK